MRQGQQARSQVALVRCENYDEQTVDQAVRRGIGLLGGIASFVRAGQKVVLKPNVLIGARPEKCITTHPLVFKAAGRLLRETGAAISYGDSPPFGSCEANLRRAGLKDIGDELGFTVADFDHGREVSHKSALLNRKFVIANAVLDADVVISLPKFKTHALTRFTGAVKNQFGCIPGVLKGQFHVKMPDPHNFAAMLVDLTTLVRPRLYLMDGVSAMEGNGPRNGKPRQMNVILLSTDPVALDAIACRMIGLAPDLVPTCAAGERAGLGTSDYESIDILGDPVESFTVSDFKADRSPLPAAGSGTRSFLKNRITPRPVIDSAICNGCGTCIKMCPVGPTALDWMQAEAGRKPKHNYRNCIRCYCCQEMCPEGAITVENPLLGRLLFRR